MESTPTVLTGAGFVLLTAIMFYLLYAEINRAIKLTSWTEDRKTKVARRFLLAITLWPALILAVSATGFFEDFSSFPPRFVLVLIVPMITIVATVLSKPVKEILPHIPTQNLVRLQVFRIFVELLIWAAFVQNALPIQMTFEGRNLDILSGIGGIMVAYFLANNRLALYAYNFIALGLLINIVTTAILSLPTPFRIFMNEPSGSLVAHFPYILLPGMLVPLAYGLGFLSLRQLGLRK
jgi:hypothetical protein